MCHRNGKSTLKTWYYMPVYDGISDVGEIIYFNQKEILCYDSG